MLLNHARATPAGWDDAIPSLCPECGARLLPRRGHVVVWHWAHHPSAGAGGAGCAAEETHWHLLWKKVYLGCPGWEVEVPLEVGGAKFRLDAADRSRARAREFVHSLSASYLSKHLALKRSGLDILWVFDGEEFVAARRRGIRGGYKHLLKPKARWLQSQVGGLVHWGGRLWRHWRHDCWYPLGGDRSAFLLDAFSRLRRAVAAGTAAAPGPAGP